MDNFMVVIGILVLAVAGVVFVYIAVRAASLAHYRTRGEYDTGEFGRKRKEDSDA